MHKKYFANPQKNFKHNLAMNLKRVAHNTSFIILLEHIHMYKTTY